MCAKIYFTLLALAIAGVSSERQQCTVRARTDAGWVCGLNREAEDGTRYASFRGVPYAQQPLGELRFQELRPVEPWDDELDATEEGPRCPQTDLLYKELTLPSTMSEACIHANIHVPQGALPVEDATLKPKIDDFDEYKEKIVNKTSLPILVFVHGGGFAFGSGGADFYGPEYLVTKGVIVITFNYRIGPFGFLTLNSANVPGNNGLRDIVTLLRWVQRNARAFGGDPDNVTLGGQSAGAAATHLLSLSDAAQGLFHRIIIMSGMGTRSFFATSPILGQLLTKTFITQLGINATDPDEIHRTLIDMPLNKIMEANSFVQDFVGIMSFVPVIETPFPGVTTILDDDPEALMAKGKGANIPVLAGFDTAECEVFRPRFEEIDIISRLKQNPLLLLSPPSIYKTTPDLLLKQAEITKQMYFKGSLSLDNYVELCSDLYFVYPALKFAQWRASNYKQTAPLFLYQFSYEGDFPVIKNSKKLRYNGTAHMEDLTYVFRTNSVLDTRRSFPPQNRDDLMKVLMVTYIANFMKCSHPICNTKHVASWPPVADADFQYQDISSPSYYSISHLTRRQQQMVRFFDSLTA